MFRLVLTNLYLCKSFWFYRTFIRKPEFFNLNWFRLSFGKKNVTGLFIEKQFVSYGV